MIANRIRLVLVLSAIFALAPRLPVLRAQTPPAPPSRDVAAGRVRDFSQDVPAHLSFVEGQVTLERDNKLEPAELNLALLVGDRIHTRGGRVEILYADGSTLKIDQETEFDLLADSLVRLLDGTLRVTIPRTTENLDYRVDAPAGSIEIRNAGEFRIDTGVDQHGESDVALTVVRGSAELANEHGRTLVRAGRQAVTTAKEAPSDAYAVNLANWDEFDQWSDARRADHVTTDSAAYLPEAVQPYSSVMDDYGTWTTEPAYGAVWYPRVADDWHPYSQGRWNYSGYYGWLWVGIDRWAWPTHHYGRWGYTDNRWFWIPGQAWSPAWVSWGYAPGYVGWSPLGYDNHSVIGWTAIGTQTVSAFRVYDPFAAWSVMPSNQFAPGVWVTEHTLAKNVIPPGVQNGFVERPSAPSGPRMATPREAAPPLRAPTRPQDAATRTRAVAAGPFDAARAPSRGGAATPRDPIRSTIIGTPADAPAPVDHRLDRSGRTAPADPIVAPAYNAKPSGQPGRSGSSSDDGPRRAVTPQIEVPRANQDRATPSRVIPRPSDPLTYAPPPRATDTTLRATPRQTAPDRTTAPGFEAVPPRGGAVERTPPAVAAPPASAPSRHSSEPAGSRAAPAAPPSSAPPAATPAPAKSSGGSGGSSGGSSSGSGGGSGRGANASGGTTTTPPPQAVGRGGRGGDGGA